MYVLLRRGGGKEEKDKQFGKKWKTQISVQMMSLVNSRRLYESSISIIVLVQDTLSVLVYVFSA